MFHVTLTHPDQTEQEFTFDDESTADSFVRSVIRTSSTDISYGESWVTESGTTEYLPLLPESAFYSVNY